MRRLLYLYKQLLTAPSRWRSIIAVCLILACFAIVTPVKAQEIDLKPPPRASSVSSGGIVYQSGAFVFSKDLLAVGSGAYPSQINFKITYRSDFDQMSDFGGRVTSNWNFHMRRNTSDTTTGTNPGTWICQWSLSVGDVSDSFQKIGCGNVGTYDYGDFVGTYLVYDFPTSTWTYTAKNGSTIKTGGISRRSEPDGTTTDSTYANGKLTAVRSNRGFGFLFENGTSTTKVCSVSFAQDYLPDGSLCPTTSPSITLTNDSSGRLISITDQVGAITTLGYRGTTSYVACVKDPGSSICRVANSWDGSDPRVDRVSAQTFANGTAATFSYLASRNPTIEDNPNQFPMNAETYVTDESGAVTTLHFGALSIAPVPTWLKDPLQRQLSMGYQIDASIVYLKHPEGDEIVLQQDSRLNSTEKRSKAKLNTGLADRIATAVYPSTCTNTITCNKPTSVTDAQGGVTDYTYDPTHGGVLSETGPAVNGVRPQVRNSYVQRYAWIKVSGGGYAHASSPVWLLSTTKTCRTTATISGACSGGSSDEVLTSFDYGPDAGPNNLLLRGVAVTSGGITRRECFSYDTLGHKISETSPSANLAVCP